MLQRSKKLSSSIQDDLKRKREERFQALRGADGLRGDDGVPGKDGNDGDQGVAGVQGDTIVGDTGARGPAGPRGNKGERGEAIKGDQGEAGQDGRGIESTAIIGVNLIITYTDGSRINVGRVVGQMGPRGVPGKTGGVFGDTTTNTTNITEEVLSPEDSANLAAIAPSVDQLTNNQKTQLDNMNLELKVIKRQLAEMTGENIKIEDIEE